MPSRWPASTWPSRGTDARADAAVSVWATAAGRRGAAVAVAALSARYLTAAAHHAGWPVVALDLYGDVDTRRHALAWQAIGRPGRLEIDPARLREALAGAARDHGVVGWIAGGGTDGDAALLDAGGEAVPRLGMSTAAIVALRTPRHFFDTLDRLGLHHPEWRWTPPPDPLGWLHKRGAGSGGMQVCPAALAGPLQADSYFQRRVDAPPMSALCLADGQRGRVVALNRLRVQALSPRLPCVFAGVRGPVQDTRLSHRVGQALDRLVPAFGLRGLVGLDFLSVDGEPWWLEINPRPPASLQLYDADWPGGLLAAHREALLGRLPPSLATVPGWRGVETCFARQSLRLDATTAQALAADPALRDLPAPGAHFAAGDPVCSVVHSADDEAALQRGLAARLDLLRRQLERPHTSTTPEETS